MKHSTNPVNILNMETDDFINCRLLFYLLVWTCLVFRQAVSSIKQTVYIGTRSVTFSIVKEVPATYAIIRGGTLGPPVLRSDSWHTRRIINCVAFITVPMAFCSPAVFLHNKEATQVRHTLWSLLLTLHIPLFALSAQSSTGQLQNGIKQVVQ